MNASLPVPAILDQDLQNFAGHSLSTLSSEHVEHQSSGPGPTGEDTQQPTYRQAHSWIAEFQKRLSPEMYNRFLNILSQCFSGTDMLETPRVEFSRLFEEAGESELWDEFLECFFQPWKEMQEIEQSELRIAEMMMENREETEKGKQTSEISKQDCTTEDPWTGTIGLLDPDDE
ncbi:MAG: hypothetical protein Q9211_002664 [Gyalolechia sp. 1 TL-2023]